MAGTTTPTVQLAGGIEMPQIGYGVFQIEDYDTCRACVREAISLGYRLFDTATAYHNEQAVGDAVAQAVAEGEVRREEFFLATKVWMRDYGAEATKASVAGSLARLQAEQLDLVLLHQPFGAWAEAWRALEDLQRDGYVRAIGTSNFTSAKMEELLAMARVKPQVNQIEIHPFYAQAAYCAELRKAGIQPEAWGPLNEGQRHIFTNPTLVDIGRRYGKSAAQVALRWSVQQSTVVIPKSLQPTHMAENLQIFDFALTGDDMRKIGAMDLGRSEIIDFENPATERLLMKLRIHD